MSVVADKKGGSPTGRWRVELKKGTERYRKRHDSFKDATADEQRGKALWGVGEDAPAPSAAREAPYGHTLLTAKAEAQGALWDGQEQEDCIWSRVGRMVAILGPSLPLDKIDTLAVDRIVKRLKADGAANATINGQPPHSLHGAGDYRPPHGPCCVQMLANQQLSQKAMSED